LENNADLIQQRHVVRHLAVELEAARKKLPQDLQTKFNASSADDQPAIDVPAEHGELIAAVEKLRRSLGEERARLEKMKVDTGAEMARAIRMLDFSERSSQTHLNRAKAARAELMSANAGYQSGKTTIDVVLDAQRRLAQAERDYHQMVSDSAVAMKEVRFRTGMLLEHYGLKIAERRLAADEAR
jgi:outer membrane protein TolC